MRSIFILLAGLCLIASRPAAAELKVGEKAPDFTIQAARGGSEFRFSLAEALTRGPVVLYFYPKSFTKGCTVEAHEFAEAADRFAAAGASLIGISADDIETQKNFSSTECRDKFPVGADADLRVIRAYDAVFIRLPGFAGISDRSSYVIGQDGTILLTYTDSAPDKHVEKTLKMVEENHAVLQPQAPSQRP
jgi:peroxiredoxin